MPVLVFHRQSLACGRAGCKITAWKKPGFGGTNAAIGGYVRLIGRFAMNTLQIQDRFEPYFDGRKTTLSHIDPRAIEKAREAKDRIEDARKAKDTAESRDRAA
jgi:hypothetical protein